MTKLLMIADDPKVYNQAVEDLKEEQLEKGLSN